MNTLLHGLIVMAIGLIVVFFGLTVLIGLIKVLTKLTENIGNKKLKKSRKDGPVFENNEAFAEISEETAADEPEEDPGEIVAAISAALVCVLGSENKFTVKHIRRLYR